ncbi:hypothetical protein LUZ61_010758 [Rhynchospora tenuis]|uniref:BED-type domain-containing protein n=1 Tax=Rhynchospora tenuis TaxID=198213 RepID=A0AAD6EZY0_9POAL|nr:hypothetical protein LUZ61_010758 [Rhynchospora tenuis]
MADCTVYVDSPSQSDPSEPKGDNDNMGVIGTVQADVNYDPEKDGEKAADCEEEGQKESPKKRKRRKTRAAVWKHFKEGPEDEDGSFHATCIYCGTKYKQGQQRGTSSMRNHIDKGCKQFSKNLRPAMQKLLQAGGKTEDKKAFCLVLDNASSNDACINELFESTPIVDDLPVGGKMFHQRCGCHILNLIVHDGLDILEKEIDKIRETMKYIRHSQSRIEKFKLACSQAPVPYKRPAWDVPTRWNSTYTMLQLALELKPAIIRYGNIDKSYKQKTSTSASTGITDTRAGFKDFMKGKKGSEPPKSELDDYLGDPIEEASLDEEFDILAWWKIKSAKYPVLSQMAQDILAVPISTVASESAFNNSGRVLNPVRSSLSDESIKALLCAQDWLRASINEVGEDIGDPLWTMEEGIDIEE